MCGIAGRYNFRTQRPVERDLVAGMCDLIAHRGPDASGAMACGPVGLGHRRLSIIDLTPTGRQPMSILDPSRFADCRAGARKRGSPDLVGVRGRKCLLRGGSPSAFAPVPRVLSCPVRTPNLWRDRETQGTAGRP